MSYFFVLALILLITGLTFQSRTTAASRFTTKNSLPTLYDMILDITKLDSALSTPAFYSLTSAAAIFGMGVVIVIFRNFILLFR